MEKVESLLTKTMGSIVPVPYLDSLYISSVVATVIYLIITTLFKNYAKKVSLGLDIYAGAMTLWILIMKRDHADLVGSLAILWLLNWSVIMARGIMEVRKKSSSALKMVRDTLSVLLFFPMPSLLVRGLFSIKPAVTNPKRTTTKPHTGTPH